jgi:putative transposase
MTIMDDLYMECPFYGQRNFRENLRDHGYSIGRKRVRRLMRIMGIEALVPKPSTSVPAKGHEIFPYLLRKRVINTVDSAFCVRALKEALRRTGRKPRIFNTDQGSQFTGKEWISELQKQGIQISMDGRGRWMDNVFIERLWRSLKYEKLRLWSYQTIPELRTITADWIEFYNHRRKHQTHGYSTPWSIYQQPNSQAA